MERYKGLNCIDSSSQAIISGALKKDKRWGLVIVRCSYRSQEQWETFLNLTKARVPYQIKSQNPQLRDVVGPDVYENLILTAIEDEQGLEGADIQTSSMRYVEWLRGDGVRELKEIGELEGWDVEGLEGEDVFLHIPSIPRYNYYIHASADMISSFSMDLGAGGGLEEGYEDWDCGKKHFHIVSPDMVLYLAERNGKEVAKIDEVDEMYRVEEEDIAEDTDVNIRVRGAALSDLYVKLMQSFDYFFDDEEEGFTLLRRVMQFEHISVGSHPTT